VRTYGATETRERRTVVGIDKAALAQIIADATRAHLGLADGIGKIEVKIEDNMEGSPAYRSGHKATVIVVEDIP